MTSVPDLTGRVVAVTGANGFVGARTCAVLADAGAEVRAVVRRTGTAPTGDDVVEVVVADLADATAVDAALVDVTHVVHCAAVAGSDHDAAAAVNVVATRLLAERAAAADVVRFVHVSTTSVVAGDADPVSPASPTVDDDAGPYAVTKRDGEVALREVADATGLALAVVRPPAVLGWGPTSTWGQRIPEMAAGDGLPWPFDPRASVGWVHVDDLAEALALALVADGAEGTHVAAAGTATWGDYLDHVASWFDHVDDLGTPADEPPTPRTWDPTSLRDLGWEPTRTFDEAMAEAAPHHR